MALTFHPKQGTIVHVDFDGAFKVPEMVKPRLCVVVSKPVQARVGLCTVVALSTTAPDPAMPYHCEIDLPPDLPERWRRPRCWVKGDMVYAASFKRVNLLRIGKHPDGKRRYLTRPLPPEQLARLQRCVLHGLGMSSLTKHL